MDPKKIFAAGDGGVYRSTARGRSWTYLDGPGINTARITDVVVSAPGENGERWIHAFGWNHFRKRESEDEWTFVSFKGGARPLGVVADPADSERLFDPSYGGVAISEDAGDTWYEVEIPRIGIGDGGSQLAFETRAPYRGYLAIDGHGLWTTSDGGRAWRNIDTPLGSRVSAVAVDPHTRGGLVIGGPDGVVRSTNRGRTWDEPTFKRTETSWLAFDPHEKGTVWAIADNPFGDRSLYRSRNGGRKFKWIEGRGLDKRSYVHAFLADPFEPGTVYIGVSDLGCYGGCGGIRRSTDGGQRWEVGTFGGLQPVVVSSLAVSPEGRLYAGTHQRGVYSISLEEE